MKVDIWMPIYVRDYMSDTQELTAEEHGCYLLLLMHYWAKSGKIGDDIERLSRVARTDEKTCRFILGSYWVLENGSYRNKRADEEMEKASARRESAQENGRKGGRPPKNNPEKTHRFSVGKPKANPEKSSSPSPSPSHINNNISTFPIDPPSAPATQEEPSRALTPMKDDLADYYQTLLTNVFPASGWGSFGKERKMLQTLAKNTKALMKDTPYEDGKELANAIFKTFGELRKYGKGDYWKKAPVTPSGLVTRWSQVVTALAEDYSKERDYTFEEVIF